MSTIDPVNQTLLVLLDNQAARTAAALEGLSDPIFTAPAGGDCHSIRQIAQHLLVLRKFQLTLLESPLAAEVGEAAAIATVADAVAQLDSAMRRVRQAVSEHDPRDWFATPAAPRQGPWGGEPTLARFARPLNDFTNHLGAVRAIRRILGNPAQRTQ